MSPILHTLIVGISSYIAVVALLRLFGKRTLSKWNAFDFVVTIALGSTLSTAMTSTDVSLAQSVTAFTLIVALQFIVTFISVRSKSVMNLVKSQPTLLFYQGVYRPDAMLAARVAEVEIRAALRENGIADAESVFAVVLETDGTFSVIPSEGRSNSSLEGVKGFESIKAGQTSESAT